MELPISIFQQKQITFPIEKEVPDSSQIPNTPMGDFQYDNSIHPISSDCSSSDFSDEIQLNSLCHKNEILFDSLSSQLQNINDELGVMISRLDNTEEDILTRRDFCRDIERLNVEYGKQIGRDVEQIEKMEFLIDHLEKTMIRRDEVLDNMKVVENYQLFDHFKKKKSNSGISCCSESDMFASVETQ